MEQFSETYESFKLRKIQLQKIGMKVEYEIEEKIGDETYSNVHKITTAIEIHQDLKNLFKELRKYASKEMNINVYQTISTSSACDYLNEHPDFAKVVKDFSDTWLKSLSVTSLIVSGKGENRGITIAGEYESPSGQVSYKLPKIKFSDSYVGYEQELESCLAEIEGEVYQYLFEGKMASLDTFGE